MTKEQNPYIDEQNGILRINKEGYQYLENIVTDTHGSVYAFKDTAPGLFVAASMARLSRNPNDMRVIYLNEFALHENKASDLLRRVITEYGDDSVQQLMTFSFVVENASNILTKRLEWGRLAAYLEQSTRYIYFDQKTPQGKFKYHTPANITASLKEIYEKNMDEIFLLYSEVVRGVTEYVRKKNPEPTDNLAKTAWMGATRAQACDVARPMLPASTTSTVGIVASGQSTESLILHLQADPLIECREVGMNILKQVTQVAPTFFEKTIMPDRGGAWVVHKMDTQRAIREMAKEFLPVKVGILSNDSVELLDFWPQNELAIIPELFFEQADEIPHHTLMKLVNAWPEERKLKALLLYAGDRLNRRHKPGRAFEWPHYKWQITADYGTFRDLQRHRIADMFEWQRLTIAYGYKVPELIIEAGYERQFRMAFSLAEKLYALFLDMGFEEEAQYATLLGHIMRYRFMLNLRAAFHFHELRTTPQGHSGYRTIVKTMHDKLGEVHPRLARLMKFVNVGEDPELTRMASELATQRKLAFLSQK